MKFSTAIATLLALVSLTQATLGAERKDEELTPRQMAKAAGGARRGRDWTIKVTNGAYDQPFGPFFVMVHSAEVDPLFAIGDTVTYPADGLAVLAEDGNPAQLVTEYTGMPGVLYAEVMAIGEMGPLFGGQTGEIKIYTKGAFNRVTIASMIINTNDGFVAMNGVEVQNGLRFSGPVYDSGSEVNNENCDSIPGPGCSPNAANEHTAGGEEGFVHVHRGFFGIGDATSSNPFLSEDEYDWRNPVLFTSIKADKAY